MIDPARVRALSEPQRRLLAQRLDLRSQPRQVDQRLVAYLVVTPGARPDAAALRQALRASLPDYMIPSEFVSLDAWPRLPSGKIDRQALRAQARDLAGTHTRFVPPRTDLERRIADIWRELLAVERVGLDDNFFDLGGHSLLLVRLHARLGETFGVDLTIIDLFSHATIRTLARLVRSNRPGRSAPPGAPDSAVRERASRQRDAWRRRTLDAKGEPRSDA
jgi:acyl carrier protein